ncbi:MAG TPA: DUF2079 domain-containing protein, partial [Candidatus Levybacteria bacterium]|nr:DUF2079 domain-containing protein [Candidatus Levybacteria bacterium]
PLAITSLIALFSRIGFMASEFLFLFASYGLYHSKKMQKWWKYTQIHAHMVILWSAIASYIAYFTFVSFTKYTNFFMGRFDLGNMDQTVWNTMHGRVFQFTNPDGVENISRLAFHADFILILLSPFYLIWSDPRMLLLVQTVVLALGGYFVYNIALRVLNHKTLALILSICYLLHPLVQKQNLYDFHAVTLVTTLFLAMWYFFIQKKFGLMCCMVILAVLTKENVYLITALFGGFLIYKKHLKLGTGIVVGSLLTFYLLMKHFIPDARGGEHFAVQFLSGFGDSLGSAVLTIVTNPVNTLSVFFQHNGFEYLKMILLPSGFLPLLSPLHMIFAVPDITKNLLADNPNFRSSYYQYNAEIIPFLMISSIYAVRILVKKIPAKLLIYYCLFFSFVGVWMYGALPFGNQPYVDIFTKPRPYAQEIQKFLATIDQSKSVAATNNLGSHLSRRENIFVVPHGIEKADYILFLNTDWYDPLDAFNKRVEDMKQDSRYTVVYQIGNFTAFQRVQ